MIYKTKIRFLRISPRKVRFILPQLKGKTVLSALEILENRGEKAAFLIKKGLKSAVDAAKAKNAQEEDLIIKLVAADDGPRLKRRLIKPRGRADIILKRMTHITVILKDKKKKKKTKKAIDRKDKI